MSENELHKLRQSLRPAFLWDAQRRRIAWANAAAVQFFGAQGLTELVERPFDAREAGVRALDEAWRQLQQGKQQVLPARLHFPSAGQTEPLQAEVRMQPLADGRPGLLVVAAAQPGQMARPRILTEILQEMPQPVMAISAGGEPVLANVAALELLNTETSGLLAGLFGSEAGAHAFLQRARLAGTAVEVRTAQTRLGPRTLRITARNTADGSLFILMLDDLTDRLRAERQQLPDASMPADEAIAAAFPAETSPDACAPSTAPAHATAMAQAPGAAPDASMPHEELQALRRMLNALLQEAGETGEAGEAARRKADQAGEAAARQDMATADPEEQSPQAAGMPDEADASAKPGEAATSGSEQRDEDAPAASSGNDAGTVEKEQGDVSAGARSRISIRVKRITGNMPGAEASGPATEEAAQAPEQAADTGPGSREEAEKEGLSPALEREDSGATSPSGLPTAAETAEATAPAEEQGAAHGEPSGSREEAQPSRPRRPEPPELVREVLDHRKEPIILHRADAFHFANAAAREMLGFAAEDEGWDEIARLLNDAHDGEKVLLTDAQGRTRPFQLKRDVFPWRSGVVVQSTLTPLDDAETPSGDEMTGEPSGLKGKGPGRISVRRSGTADATAERGRQAPRSASAPVIRIHTERGLPSDDAGTPTAHGQRAAGEQVQQASSGGNDHDTASAMPPANAAFTGVKAAPAPVADHEPAQEPSANLQAMLETAADGIITLNARGEILSFSAGAQRLFGHADHEVLGRPFRELLAEESRSVLDVRLVRLREEPKAAQQRDRGREVMGLRKDGSTIPLYMTLGALRHARPGDTEHRASFCVVVHDISAWKRRERELEQAKEEAEALSARKSEFLARISHELRTPLNAILGFSDVLRQELYGRLGNEKYRDYARDIYDSGEHLLALVNDLLDLARIEAGRYELDMREVDLAGIVEETVNLLRVQVGEAGVVLRRIVPDGLPKVVADARSLKQVLLNLLSNAVKFSNRGDQVVIALRQRPDGGLELVVKDTGPGMSKEELQTALEPFRRVSRTGADKPGTGLGLPLAKALAEANRARFEIESEPGRGTEARVIFPPHRVLA